MQTITTTWGASYKGIGVTLHMLPDGTYQGISEDGHQTVPCADAQAALAALKAHIDAQGEK